jgi:hypothetical protein
MEIKEKMKNEALERMKSLKLHENVICEFEKEDKLNKSFAFGILYWLTEEEKQLVKEWEEETGNLVYHVIENQFEFGHCYSLLYVSKYEEEWEMDRDLIKYNTSYAYVINTDDDMCSELGAIGIVPKIGGIMRTA